MTFKHWVVVCGRLALIALIASVIGSYLLYEREMITTAFVYLIPVLPLLLFVSLLMVRVIRHGLYDRRFERDALTYAVLLRSDMPNGAKYGGQFWNQASDLIPQNEHVVFAVSAVGGQYVRFELTALPQTVKRLINEILADWAGSQVRPIKREKNRFFSLALKPKKSENAIQTTVNDPITPLLVDLSRLRDGVVAGFALSVRPDRVTRSRLLKLRDRLGDKKSDNAKRYRKEISDRLQCPFLEVRPLVYASDKAVAWGIAKTVSAQFQASNRLNIKRCLERSILQFPLMAGTPWTDTELGVIAHFLGQEGKEIAPQLSTASARSLPPSPASRVPRGAVMLPKGFAQS